MKILIVKTSALGDIIQAFPVLQFLKNCYPEAQIDWVVESPFASLLEAHPSINKTIQISTKKWRDQFRKPETGKKIKDFYRQLRSTQYDLLFDLQGNLKSGLVVGLSKANKKIGFGFSTVHEWPNIFFTNYRCNPPKGRNIREDYLFLAQQAVGDFNPEIKGVRLNISNADNITLQSLLQNPLLVRNEHPKSHNLRFLNEKSPRIMVCTGSNWPNKQLDKASLLAFLKLIVQGLQARLIFIWGTEEEKQLVYELASYFPQNAFVSDKLSLPLLQNLMAELDLVIAMDSLPLHLAATTPTPTYSVFGASLAYKYKPVGRQHGSFQGQCPFEKKFEKRCPILRTCSSGRCIKDIKGEILFDHFNKWWRGVCSQKPCN